MRFSVSYHELKDAVKECETAGTAFYMFEAPAAIWGDEEERQYQQRLKIESLTAENERLRNKIAMYEGRTQSEATSKEERFELRMLRAKLAVAVEALEKIERDAVTHGVVWQIARAALSKLNNVAHEGDGEEEK